MESSTRKCGRQQRGPESDGRAKGLGPTNRVVGTERRLWASCRALGSNLSDRSKWGLLAGSRDMFRYRRQMRKFFGVFGDLFLFKSRFDAGKHFYDNAVLRPLKQTTTTLPSFGRPPFSSECPRLFRYRERIGRRRRVRWLRDSSLPRNR